MTGNEALEIVLEAAVEAAERTRVMNAWNYDTIEVAANRAVAEAFDRLAGQIRSALGDG